MEDSMGFAPGQDDPEKGLESAAAVDAGRLLQFLRHIFEMLAQHKDIQAILKAHRRGGQDEQGPGGAR